MRLLGGRWHSIGLQCESAANSCPYLVMIFYTPGKQLLRVSCSRSARVSPRAALLDTASPAWATFPSTRWWALRQCSLLPQLWGLFSSLQTGSEVALFRHKMSNVAHVKDDMFPRLSFIQTKVDGGRVPSENKPANTSDTDTNKQTAEKHTNQKMIS